MYLTGPPLVVKRNLSPKLSLLFLTANQDTSCRPRQYVQDNFPDNLIPVQTRWIISDGQSTDANGEEMCFRDLPGPEISAAEWAAMGDTKWVKRPPPSQQQSHISVSCSDSLGKLIANNQTEEDFTPLDGPTVS